MHFTHSERIWREFPRLVPGVLVVSGLHRGLEVEGPLTRWLERARERFSLGSESQLPEIEAWRRAYSQMGMKPTQYRSAAEALLRRFRKEGSIPRVHPFVDLSNVLSLAFALPVAVFDLSHVDSFLVVRHATGIEKYLAFSGEIETPPADEVIFADAAGRAHARRWTFRQSRESAVGADTAQVLVVTEALHDAASGDVVALLDALVEESRALGCSLRARAVLSADSPRLDFEID